SAARPAAAIVGEHQLDTPTGRNSRVETEELDGRRTGRTRPAAPGPVPGEAARALRRCAGRRPGRHTPGPRAGRQHAEGAPAAQPLHRARRAATLPPAVE